MTDIKRVAFETRPVTADSSSPSSVQTASIAAPSPQLSAALTPNSPPAIDRAAIAELVDRFLTARKPVDPAPPPAPDPKPTPPPLAKSTTHKAVDFVCEDDVKRALAKGEKIYVNTKTIITPSARDLGQSSETFAKGN